MADAIGVTSGILGILDVSLRLLSLEFSTPERTYGFHVAFFISVNYKGSASEYARIEKVVLQGDDDEALLFRASVATECNMTAVAVSLSILTKNDADRHIGCYHCPGRSHCTLVAKSKSRSLDGSGLLTLRHRRRLPLCLLCLQITKNYWQIVSSRNGQRLAYCCITERSNI